MAILLSFGRFGMILSIITLIVTIVVAYFTPDILVYFNNETLMSDDFYISSAVRLYAGSLVSVISCVIVQYLLWLLVKGILITRVMYLEYLDDAKAVRNFYAVIVFVLYGLLFLIGGITVVKL